MPELRAQLRLLRRHPARLLTLTGVSALVACSAGTPRAQISAVPASEPPAARAAEGRQAASDHFYRGKALALSGDVECARAEFQASLVAFRDAARPGNSDDLAFGEQLWESVRRYQGVAAGLQEREERQPAEEADSLIARAPSSTREELEAAKREVDGAPAAAFDIPVVVNEQVLRAIAFYQFRTPYQFAGALQRSGRYMPMMRALLKEKGLPQDLVFVAMVESAFKAGAHSHAAAHGFWQFIDGTARRYGLRKTRYLDERSDPVKSTLAAGAYLKDLYEMFGDWHLAMAAYDTGEGRILRGLQRTGAADYWELSATNQLHRETRDYVPFVMAAALIYRDPARFGFDVVPDPPMAFDQIQAPRPVDLAGVAEAIGADLEELEGLNPELRTRSTPRDGGSYPLRVPPGTGPKLIAQLASLPEAPQIVERRVSVKKGDTVARLAKRYGVSVADLCDWNDIKASSRLKRGRVMVIASLTPKAGQKRLLGGGPTAQLAAAAEPPKQPARGQIRAVPTPSSMINTVADLGKPQSVALELTAPRVQPVPRPLPSSYAIPREGFVNEPAATLGEPLRGSPRPSPTQRNPASQRLVHRVRRGETLRKIAERYGLTVDAIRRQNRLRSTSISIGQRLTLTLAAIH